MDENTARRRWEQVDNQVIHLLFCFQSNMAGEDTSVREIFREFKLLDSMLDTLRET